jgi:anti-sigma factor RsiW
LGVDWEGIVSEFQWLEIGLARELSPVAAPEALWERIRGGGKTVRPTRSWFGWVWWPVAAAVLLMVSGGVEWRVSLDRHDQGNTMERLAEREFIAVAGGPKDLDIRSEDPREIRTWAKAKANVDIELPGSSSVRLLGARLIRQNGAPVAAVAYNVGDSAATLLVSRKAGGGIAKKEHVFSRVESAGGARLISWSMREQVYTVASSAAKDPEAPCALCHADHPSGGILKITSHL